MLFRRPRTPFWIALCLAVLLYLGVAINSWLREYEPFAIWLEGIALVLIFIWDRIEGNQQYVETLRQLKVAEDQAAAMQLSARAAINAQRPWLVVHWNNVSGTSGMFSFTCRNSGRTPAKIVSISARDRYVLLSPEKLELPPDYSFSIAGPDLKIISPDDSFAIGTVIPEVLIQNNGKIESVNGGAEYFIYYGQVTYRDTLYPESTNEGLHHTTFCFVYEPDKKRFFRGGPVEYNRYA
jgi:hypothetical protein